MDIDFAQDIRKLQWASESVNEVIICASMECERCPYHDEDYERWVCVFTWESMVDFLEGRAGVWRLYPRRR